MDNSKHMLVIDGNSLLFRAFYATYYGDPSSIMRTSAGIPSNAIFAFSNMLAKLLNSLEEGGSLFLAFDTDSQTFRKEEFASYKANRKPAPEELCAQFGPARELVKALGIPFHEQHGIEADDLAGTVSRLAENAGYRVDVYTSDKDYLQLVTDRVTVHLLKKGLSDLEEVTPSSMVEHYGFSPRQIIDYKGLRGDSSDNLPGIPGIGEKTATKLIQTYGSFDAIIDAAKAGTIKGKLGENIVKNEEIGRLCHSLATMKLDCALPFGLDDLVYRGYDAGKVSHFASEFELKTLLSRLPKRFRYAGDAGQVVLPPLQKIRTLEGIALPAKVGLSLDLEENVYNEAEVQGIGIATKEARYYLDRDALRSDAALKRMLEDPTIEKTVYDGKKIRVGLSRLGIDFQGITFDLLLAGYLLDSSLTGNASILFSSFGVSLPEKEGGLLAEGNPEETSAEAFYAYVLEKEARNKLETCGATSLLSDLEIPLSIILADMEIEGFPLDPDELSRIGAGFRAKRDALESEIFAMAGHPFNIASPKQVASVLYDELGLKGPKNRSTSVEELRFLSSSHPLVGKILEYRKYAKLVGTYIDGLLPHRQKDGKIHTCFNQAQTTTGRLSSSNPNLQNISTRDEESKEIRKAFHYADPSKKILSLDYSQIELRVLASLSHCQSYIDVFRSGRDVHSETARKIFGVPEGEEVPHELRRKAKAINFAIIYGTTAFGLAEQMGGTPQEASKVIASFYAAYPEIGDYLSATLEEGEKKGYVTTMLGRRRYLPELKDANYVKREAAKRAALNAPVQGSAADLIKMAMIRVDRVLKDGHFKSKMVLQIHDELLFCLEKDEEERLVPLLRSAMENAVPLSVPLTVEGESGDSWFDAKD